MILEETEGFATKRQQKLDHPPCLSQHKVFLEDEFTDSVPATLKQKNVE